MKQKPNLQTFQKPCLRGDLVFTRHTGQKANITIVKDPLNDRFYRFGPIEAFILRQLNGTNGPNDIQEKVKKKFAADLDRETIDGFVISLNQRGLLESGEGPTKPSRKSRFRGSLLYMRFKAFDPDKKLDKLVEHVRFCFTRRFVFGSLVLMLLALLTFLVNFDEIVRDFSHIFNPATIIPALLIVLATTIGHEFAHGLTCKHFGGRVREMGFLLLFFQPALYCNVSDAWLFPEKSKRMWVGLAGTYFEMVLWALAVFVWRITAPETALNFLALVLLGTSGIRIFLNLNPLIKLDGYYVLSDWLEIPNLRARAFAFIRVWARRPWALARINLPKRDKRIYLWYGLAGMGFTVWILGYIATAFARFLTGSLQGTGFVIFVSLLVFVFHKPILKLWFRLFPRETRAQGNLP